MTLNLIPIRSPNRQALLWVEGAEHTVRARRREQRETVDNPPGATPYRDMESRSNALSRLPAKKLTPIKIRGKKRRPTMDQGNSGDKKKIKGGRKGPKSDESEAKMARYSPLERLPAELIEQIFLECLEINLPRASPHVAGILSTEWLYRGLIMQSLWNDPAPKDELSAPYIRKSFGPFNYTPMGALDRQKMQQMVLGCRWCTLERVKSVFPDIIKLSLHRWDFVDANGNPKEDVKVTSPDELDVTADLIQQYPRGIRRLYCLPSADGDNTEQGGAGANTTDANNSITVPCLWYSPKLSPVTVLTFPTKVLRGSPWSEAKMDFFEFLRLHLTYIKGRESQFPLYTADNTAYLEGVRSAILSKDCRVLRDLLELGSTLEFEREMLFSLPGEYFNLASRQGEHATALLMLLVRAAPLSIPSDDTEITEWAMEAETRKDDFGIWLLNYLRDVPVYRRDNIVIFVRGQCFANFPTYRRDYEAIFGTEGRLSFAFEINSDLYPRKMYI